MNTNGIELPLKNEVYQIVGAALEVLKVIGPGLPSTIYENSMIIEFGLREIEIEQERSFPVTYKGAKVGEFVPDLIAFGSVAIDVKVVDGITDHDRGRMLNCLRSANLRVGIVANFKNARLEWERVDL